MVDSLIEKLMGILFVIALILAILMLVIITAASIAWAIVSLF